jgi:serine/threonine-protein kinase HipA
VPDSSLGGARPKASVREKGGHLAIAKFPSKDDEINTVV